MNQTDKKIRQELESRRQALDELRRRIETVEAEVRLLESLAGEAATRAAPAKAASRGTRKERTRQRLEAMRRILLAHEPGGLGVSELARQLSQETGTRCTRGAVNDLLNRYGDIFEKTAEGDRWRPTPGGENAIPPP